MSKLVTRGPLVGAVEGGGTKFVCAVAERADRILARTRIATRDAQTTLAQCVEFFQTAERELGRIESLGFACFGPLELNRAADDFGCTLPTPKPGWSGVNLLAPFAAAFDVPIALDTDVGAAALAEWQLGAGQGMGSLAYVTVGTGIGGAIVPTEPAAGRLMHAEMGHLLVRRDPRDLDFAGVCPFHGDCLEGLASGPAIDARWGRTLDRLAADHPGTDVIAGYLGQLGASIALIAPVERIVFGGGVMATAGLVDRVGAATLANLGDYLGPLRERARAQAYVSAPGLGDDAGIVGAILLAERTRA
jgi:fructokinase